MTFRKIRYIAALAALIIIMCAAFAYAYTDGEDEAVIAVCEVIVETNNFIIVNATWLDDDMLRIDVTDLVAGTVSSIAIRLSDFVSDAENSPYFLIQAADLDGNLSGVIQVVNPFYIPYIPAEDEETCLPPDNNSGENNDTDTIIIPEIIIPPGLTPDGTGTVIDNVLTQNGIEFFTVFTEEGNEFFLVVDRQRGRDNVYLLNAVTESDLMALAELSGNPIVNTPTPDPPAIETPTETDGKTPGAEPEAEEPEPESGGNVILIVVVVIAVGGIAYYLKIVRPKKNAVYDDDDDFDDDQDDESGDFNENDYDEDEDGGEKR